MANANYNPDVLNCIANLSNDEVFTPPELANKMLDLLPQELFRSPETTFLDPFTKSGVFLREIVKRLDRGLQEKIPDRQKRIDHIMHKQVFGIAITELTSLLARRSVYCSKKANGKYSISKFETEEGNILYKNIKHTWVNGKCKYCGASQAVYDRGPEAEQYAYMFIHTDNPNQFFKNMKFDVIIGNPPYQLTDGGGVGDAAKPIYNLFIEASINISPRYLALIVPSRWMKGGRGLENFRNKFITDTRLKIIVDYEDASNCFSGLHIDGGVCYFLWDKDYKGKALYIYHGLNEYKSESIRFLKTPFSDTVIRDNRQIPILEKIFAKKEIRFSSIVSPQKPYGIRADFFNSPERYLDKMTSNTSFEGACKIYGVKGKKGGAKRISTYIAEKDLFDYNCTINHYKLFFSKAFTTTATIPPEIIVAGPHTACTETFLVIGKFTKEEALNCLSYIKTKFFRSILFFYRHSLNISKDSFEAIPLQDFSHPWTDEMLYKKYGLTEEEIAFIESMIRPME
ncbi:MAG: Eco57I restriction-modification methylase domain-containing protein [Alloprevotella sp.]|nr:Eco57I restriction-modification methylase domain-containing protein [Alloprevotella sp.]